MLNLVRQAMIQESFQGLVGMQIFCRVGTCRSILDCTRAVEVTVNDSDNKPVKTDFFCATCFDRADLATLQDTVLTPNGLTLEVTDGRLLFASNPQPTTE